MIINNINKGYMPTKGEEEGRKKKKKRGKRHKNQAHI